MNETGEEIRRQASLYIKNRMLLHEIREAYARGYIDRQQMLTLRGQALNGDGDGATKGLAKLMWRTDV